jgi:hypothetical protein
MNTPRKRPRTNVRHRVRAPAKPNLGVREYRRGNVAGFVFEWEAKLYFVDRFTEAGVLDTLHWLPTRGWAVIGKDDFGGLGKDALKPVTTLFPAWISRCCTELQTAYAGFDSIVMHLVDFRYWDSPVEITPEIRKVLHDHAAAQARQMILAEFREGSLDCSVQVGDDTIDIHGWWEIRKEQ